MKKLDELVLRPCFEHDLDQVRLIYGHHVTTGAGTFEVETPSIEEMHARWRKVVAGGWPFMVATLGDDRTRVIGYAYAQQFRDRQAYAFTAEDSVYVAPGWQRRGVGFACLAALLMELQRGGARKVLALIGDSENAASIALHGKLGFDTVGTLRGVGYKFGRWLDVVIMERGLDAKVLAPGHDADADNSSQLG